MTPRLPILLAGAAAGLAAVVLVRMVPVDAPIPAGYARVVEDARTSLVTHLDAVPALRFARVECTADGGYVVWFTGMPPFAGDQVFVADSAGPYAAGDWGGGVTDAVGGDTGFIHAPVIACA